MSIELNLLQKRHSFISYSALVVGIICFLIVFVTPIRIAHIGNSIGDAITIFLTTIGLILSLAGLLIESEKKLIPVISLLLCSSFFIVWISIVFKTIIS